MANLTLTPEITDVLTRSTIVDNRLILPNELPRNVYTEVNKVLVNAGGKWDKKSKSHLFVGCPKTKLGLALESGVSIDEKKKFQAFFTPPELAKQVVELVDVEGQIVLEPSAGEGALVKACLKNGALRVDCIEINYEYAKKIREKSCRIVVEDFLTSDFGHIKYNRIIMNPPFTKNQDIKHVEHALNFLAPGGILVAIMSPNTNRSKFIKLVNDFSHEIIEVEKGTFKESGTSIATIIVRIFK